MHVFNPAAGGQVATYNLAFRYGNIYPNQQLQPGQMRSYDPAGKDTFVTNTGPVTIQAIYFTDDGPLEPLEAGWELSDEVEES